jgi:methyl-accepting chemotaxis protein
MNKLLIQLRIGEKIAIGVGLVGLLFLGVIWFYQQTLKQSLTDYQSLVQIHAANKDHLLAIENKLLIARKFDAQYMQKRDPSLAQKVYANLVLAEQEVERLSESDHSNQSGAAQFNNQLQAYRERFKAVEEAWIKKGVNEDAGLQGSFRNAVHDLQKMAGNLNADNIYLTLLQIRRGEKDLGLRRETLYQQRVHALIDRFMGEVETSQLLTEVKEKLLSEIAIYRTQFDLYAEKALSGQSIEGGKGLFRDSAHRLEDLLNQYYVPDLERDILQLRRREKDYLLRGDEKYVQMVLNRIAAIEERIQNSGISAEERKRFTTLLQRYRTDFLALIEQNQLIEELTTQMEERASRVTSLVNHNVATANQAIAELIQQINLRVQERTVWMMWVIVIAIGFGILFTIKITSLIVRPMREMATVLEKLTHTELISPIRHIEGGRDEVNHMAGFINTLVEQRNRFIRWWRNSMNQQEACSQLRSILERPTHDDAETISEIDKLRQALAANMDERKQLIADETQEVGKQNEKILSCSAKLLHPSIGRGDVDEQAKMIYYAAEMIKRHLEMLSK